MAAEFQRRTDRRSGDERITIPEIAFLEVPMQRILTQMKPAVERHQYGVMIVDDTSGRLPGLVLLEVFNDVYLKKHEPPMYPVFVQGSRYESDVPRMQSRLQEQSRQLDKLEPNQRALLVTEYVETGRTLERFEDVLLGAGIPYDIATVRSQHEPLYLKSDNIIAETTEYYLGSLGPHRRNLPLPHGKPQLTGLINGIKYPDNRFITDPEFRSSARQALRQSMVLADRLKAYYAAIPPTEAK
jgi:hypothetical protein